AMLAFIVFPRLPRNTETGIADGEDARRKGIFRNFGGTRTGILPAPDLRFGHEMLLSERPAFSVKFLDSEGQPPNAESIYWRADAISRYAHGRWIEDTGWKMVYDRSDGVPDNLVRLSMEPAGVLIPHTLHADRGHFFDCIPGVYPMFAVAVPAINPRVEVNGEGAVRPYRHDPFDIGVLSRRTVQFWDMAQGAVAAHPDPKYTEKNGIPERLAAKAKEVAGSQAGAYGKITSLKNELFATCRYSFRYAATPGVDPVEEFVFERRQGSCALFASALTLMLRSVDVPARLALGYKGGVPHRQEEHALVVRECDAHAWVEVHFEGHGWLPVEATPSTTAAAFVDATHDLDEARPGLYDRAYTWWAREVVGYSSRKQRQVMLGLRTRMTGIYRKVRMLVDEHGWGIVVAAAALAAAVVLAKMIAGIRRRRRLEGLPEMRGPFYNLLRHLSRLGMKRRLGETPREYAVTLARAAVDLPDIDRAVHLFYAWRYGERDTLEALDAEVTSIIARLPGRIYGIMQRETSEGRAGSDES
ncbi:MAG: transglutaminase domain-containing protein, partial [Planctomycetes bacterium]|nr:transglutaminase domain-containing protein [Planctomycetota bacterium]